MRRARWFRFAPALAAAAALLTGARATHGAPTWRADQGGWRHSRGYVAIELLDTSIVAVGSVVGTILDDEGWILHLDPTGTFVSSRTLGRANLMERFLAGCPTADGGFVAAGDYEDQGWLVRFDGALGIAWQLGFGGEELQFFDVVQTEDGGFLATGHRLSGASNTVVTVLSVDGDGNVRWMRSHPLRSFGYGFAGKEIPGAGFAVVGYHHDGGSSSAEPFVLRLDDAGAVAWHATYASPSLASVTFTGLAAADDGGLLVIGEAVERSSGDNPLLAVRIGPAGDVTWARLLDGTRTTYWQDVRRMPCGRWLVTGNSASGSAPWIGVLDDDGNLVSARTHDIGTWASGMMRAGVAADDSLIITAWVRPTPTGPDGTLVTRMLADGTQGGDCLTSPASVSTIPVDVSATRVAGTSGAVSPRRTMTTASWTDFAVTGSLQCAGDASPTESPPGEVSPPGSAAPLRVWSPSTLIWEDAGSSCSQSFQVYRGLVSSLVSGSHGSCLASDLGAPTLDDPELPGLGRAWFYLVRGRNAGGDGSLGTTSTGAVRVPETPCP